MPSYCERAAADCVPERAVRRRCRNWGVPNGLAAQIAEESAAESRARALVRDRTHSFPTEADFRAWVTRVALNLAADVLRRSNRDRPLPADAPTPPVPIDRPPAFDQLVAGLPSAEQRTILRLTYVDGLTLDEMAERLAPPDRSPNAGRLWVKRRRDAALAALARTMPRGGDG